MKTAILIIAVSLVFTSCNNSANKAEAEVSTDQTNNVTATDEHEHSTSESIELDNGAKWKVVPEMMQHITNIESDINQFDATQHTDMKDYTALGINLQNNLDLLTGNCTMEGKAHDELHKWLLPFIDKVEAFNKLKDKEEAEKSAKEIKNTFTVFHTYFE